MRRAAKTPAAARPADRALREGGSALVGGLLQCAVASARRIAGHLAARQMQRDIDRLPEHIRRDIGFSQSDEARHRREVEVLRLQLGR